MVLPMLAKPRRRTSTKLVLLQLCPTINFKARVNALKEIPPSSTKPTFQSRLRRTRYLRCQCSSKPISQCTITLRPSAQKIKPLVSILRTFSNSSFKIKPTSRTEGMPIRAGLATSARTALCSSTQTASCKLPTTLRRKS
jgi:hypothetical protein